MTYFGDIAIPWVSEKDTSVTKEVIEKNFVDKAPDVYELNTNLESGSYSIILNEEYHPRNESFEEQHDAVLSMPSRHASEFPVDVGGDIGYVDVTSSTTTSTPQQEIDEGEISIYFYESDEYSPAVKSILDEDRFSNFVVEPVESLIGFPSFINVVGETSDYTIPSEDGDIDLYIVTSGEVLEFNSADIVEAEQESICRLFDGEDNRVYSDSKDIHFGSNIENSLIDITFNGNSSSIEYYSGSWNDLGQVELASDYGYASDNSNDFITVEFINDNGASIYRGFPCVEYNFEGESTFTHTLDGSLVSEEDYYLHYQNTLGDDMVMVRKSSDGLFFDSSSAFGVEQLNTSKEYNIFIGYVPDGIPVEDYARYVYYLDKTPRTMI